VREAVFSAMASWAGTSGGDAASHLINTAFLDLFAGSGAVALEAASRGASPVWAVESDRGAAAIIRRNADATGLAVQVVARSVEAFLAAAPPTAFGIVWADPPYAFDADALDALLAALAADPPACWLAPESLVMVERSSRERAPRWPAALEVLPARVYGETSVYVARKGGA